MDRKDYQFVEMLGRVVEFGETHPELFPKTTFSGEAFSALGAMLSKFTEQSNVHQSSRKARRDNRQVKQAARDALIQQLQRARTTAAAISIDTPISPSKFRVFTEDRKRDAALLQCGKAFVKEAEAAKDAFVQHRLPVDTLHAAVADFESAMSKAVAGRAGQANAKKAVDEARAECLKLLQRVDAVVANTLADDPTLTAEWKLRRRIVQRGERVLEEPPPEAAVEASS